MGCGSSSLKGEKADNVNAAPKAEPIKRVQTNFSDIDFTGDAGNSRRGKSFAVAPDEHRRPTRISEHGNEEGIPSLAKEGAGTTDGIMTDRQHHAGSDGEKLAPYQTIEGDHGLASPNANPAPQINYPTPDPTSSMSKDAYASANQPANATSLHPERMSSTSSSLINEKTEERKQSWFARTQDRFTGRDVPPLSDEDIKCHFGMTRAEWEAWTQDPKNGAGKHQKPENMPSFGVSPVYGAVGGTGF